ncbi:hypothetical protein [Paenibacillus tritici]|uniref:hypothetical protein n=1 Tax=Paenibacillus tritici TaxID=1873425 RepID=UPI00345DFC0C
MVSRRYLRNESWKLYRDKEYGNLSTSVEAYYSLLYSGYSKVTDEPMLRAKDYIQSKGGIGKVTSTLTRVILAATGQSKWPLSISSIPLEVLLFPAYFPINYFEFSGYSRVHLTPMLIMADRRFSISTANAPNLSDLLETRIESDGTLYSYAISTILMMLALLALDYDQQHPLIV